MKKSQYIKSVLAIVLIFNVSFLFGQYTKLYDFKYNGSDGNSPYGSLIYDGTYLYGTTLLGGTNTKGTIYRIKSDGTGYNKLFDFDGTNGYEPLGALVSDGIYLYGTTLYGGTNNKGVIFKIKPDGTSFSKLFDFGGINGVAPNGSLIYDGTYLYGTTGESGVVGGGLIFKIKPDGTDYTVLMNFGGASCYSPLTTDGTYLYGMTYTGNSIFKIKPDGTNYTQLFHDLGFKAPLGSLTHDGTYLCGTTTQSGINNAGTFFKIQSDGTGYVNLFDFSFTDGKSPNGSLIYDGTYMYGTTIYGGTNDNSGVIFKIKPDGTNYTKLFDFKDTLGSTATRSSLTIDGMYLYGVTTFGGMDNVGVIFKINKNTVATGIQELPTNTQIKIYPNPVDDILNVELLGFYQKVEMQIVDVLGNVIKNSTLNTQHAQIDVSKLQSGIYFLKVGNRVQKFIKE